LRRLNSLGRFLIVVALITDTTIQGRAIDTFQVPLTISTVNAIIWTLLIQYPFKSSFVIQEEPWGSLYTLVLTTSLAFMLVFRLNRVAIRWWDTRTMWGSVVANVRSLTSAIVEHCSHDLESRDEAICWTAGYLISLKQHMREEDGHFNYDELTGFLSKDQVDKIIASHHPCLYAASEIRCAINRACTVTADTPIALATLYVSNLRLIEHSLDVLIYNMGGLERVRSTPLPIVFVTHLRTFIMFYLLSLPFLYGHTWGWGTIPAVFVTSYALLGIDGAATECESPFKKRPNHLDMESFCITAFDDIEQIVRHNHEMQERQQRRNSY
jgi:Predicted membrane protein